MPQPPYILLFEEVVPGASPLTILVDERSAVPLFDSQEGAGAFVASTDFGASLEPVEVLLAELGHLRRDDDLAVGLEAVVAEVVLVVILGDVELVERCHLGHD